MITSNSEGKLRITWRGYLIMTIATIIGCCLALGGELWWNSAQPKMTVIHSIGVEKTPSGAHFIIIAQTGPAAKNCLRVTQHVIYRDYPAPEGGTIRQYVPLGMALNGLGFSNISETVVMLEAPSGTPAGSWDYVNRSVYFCSIPPGLTKITQSTSAPRSVELK